MKIDGPYILYTGNEDWYDIFFDKYRNTGIVIVNKQVDSDGNFLCHLALYWCPCGCGEHRGLPVNYNGSSTEKAWGFQVNTDTNHVTFTPSIWTNKENRKGAGCNSHYIITNGIVQWC